MKKTASQKWRLLLTKNFIMMLVMLVVIIVAVSAWFTVNKTVTANNITVKAESSEVDIADSIKTRNASHDVVTDGPGEFGSKLEFKDIKPLTKDCTGNGFTILDQQSRNQSINLFVPEFNNTNDFDSVRLNGGKEVNTNLAPAMTAISDKASVTMGLKEPEKDPPEYQFYEFDFYVRSKNEALMLSADSQVVSETEALGRSLATTGQTLLGYGKKSAYGDFNVDGLVGAIRVSLTAEGCTDVQQSKSVSGGVTTITTNAGRNLPENQMVWVPRPDVYLYIPETARDISNWRLLTGVLSNSTYTRPENQSEVINTGEINYRHTYYRSGGSGVEFQQSTDGEDKTVVSSGTYNNVKSLGRNVNISSFPNNYQRAKIDIPIDLDNPSVKGQYYLTKYTMRVWIEGTDTEARRAMDGGAFNITLKFQ